MNYQFAHPQFAEFDFSHRQVRVVFGRRSLWRANPRGLTPENHSNAHVWGAPAWLFDT